MRWLFAKEAKKSLDTVNKKVEQEVQEGRDLLAVFLEETKPS